MPEPDGPQVALFVDVDYLRVVCRTLRTTPSEAAVQIRASAVHFGALRLCLAYASKPFSGMKRLEQDGYLVKIAMNADFDIVADVGVVLDLRRRETVVLVSGDRELLSGAARIAGMAGRCVVVIASEKSSASNVVASHVFFMPLENIIRGQAMDQISRIAENLSSLPRKPQRRTAYDFLVFLCHASGDKPAVRALYQRLQADGFPSWLDEENLLPGQDWEREISAAVRASNVVLVCLSRASVTKEGFVQKEIRYALDVADEKPEGTIFIIPVRLENCDVPQRLRRLHWVNLFEMSGYRRLLSALRTRQQTARRNQETLANAEEEQIRRVLAATGGNKRKAAQILGIEQKALGRKLEQMKV